MTVSRDRLATVSRTVRFGSTAVSRSRANAGIAEGEFIVDLTFDLGESMHLNVADLLSIELADGGAALKPRCDAGTRC